MKRWDIACGLVALGFISLIDTGGPGFAESPQLATLISTNQSTFKPGYTLTVTAGVRVSPVFDGVAVAHFDGM